MSNAKSPTGQRKTGGFSLIELMIVVVIVAIVIDALYAVLDPRIRRA